MPNLYFVINRNLKLVIILKYPVSALIKSARTKFNVSDGEMYGLE